MLKGKVKPDILVDIIASNRWHRDKKIMVVDNDDAPSFNIVKSTGYHFMYPESDEGLQWPVISKESQMEGSGFSNKVHFILKDNGKGFGIEYNKFKLVT